MMTIRVVMALACALTLVSCGKNGNPTGPGGSGRYDVSGRFNLFAGDNLLRTRGSLAFYSWFFTVTQHGAATTGTVTGGVGSPDDAFAGTLDGSISDNVWTFTVSVPPGGINSRTYGPNSCAMTLTASVSMDRPTPGGKGGFGDTMTLDGTYSGTRTCAGPISGGTLSGTKFFNN
jgi:hypothetical protein